MRGVMFLSSRMQNPWLIAEALSPTSAPSPGAVQLTYIAEIDNDAATLRDQRFYHFFNFTGSFADQSAVTFDCSDLISAFIFLLRLFNFTMEGTI
jgi:hypothetical protein